MHCGVLLDNKLLMNGENQDIINRFLLIGTRFMPEMHLWDPEAKKYYACGLFTRHK